MSIKKKNVKVRFSASGYPSYTKTYNSWEEACDIVEEDAKEIAAEHDGEVEERDREWVVNSRDGEEIARWEIET